MSDEQTVTTEAPAQPEMETRAKEMGWVPKEEFRGDESRWMPADRFVQRGEELMPLLRANNRKLTDELTSTRGALTEAQQVLRANQEAIEELKKFNADMSKEKRQEQKQEVLTALAEAKREGNVEQEVALMDQLSQLNVAPPPPREAPPPRVEPSAADMEAQARQTPVWKEWAAANPWFGQDQDRTDYAEFVGRQLRLQGHREAGREFLDAVAARVNKTFGAVPTARDAPNRVEGARGGNGSSGSSGRSYADLPADARAACDKQANRLVGAGRAFKTDADWRKHYVSVYFKGE